MHELSLMVELINIVSEDASQRKMNHVNKIEVIVGDLSNVLPDALELAFLYIREQGLSLIDEHTELHIIREAAKAKCLTCQQEFVPDYRIAFCPKCQLSYCLLLTGETFRVESYEGSDICES